MKRFTLMIVALMLSTILPSTSRADPYLSVVVGDMGGLFPINQATYADAGVYINCLAGFAVCPPGADMGGFPPNNAGAADLGAFLTGLQYGSNAFNPSTGYINFTADPANPIVGDGYYAVQVTNVLTASSGSSGLKNVRGELQIQAEIIVDATGGAFLGASVLPITGPDVISSAGIRANGAAGTDLFCGPSVGDVTIRFFSQSYKFNIANGEVCSGGVLCAPGEHWDQLDLIVSCN